ncbi:MAG: hydroxymethylbilane synthase [Armatimonadetes bacterium]|nr:hydroxymethylbilane synthase [Armatimonadota bacterium]
MGLSVARRLVIGTRGSQLALRQAEWIAERLRAHHAGVEIVLRTITTTADRHPTTPLEQLPTVGVFVKELEAALLDGAVDLAAHSLKDLPTRQPDGVVIAAVPEREDPRDVLVTRDGRGLDGLLNGARVGTSSPRRAAMLRHARPDLVMVPLRGNLDTRLRRLDAGQVDALCLAGAGLRRLGLEARVAQWLEPSLCLPAPGQGALAVEARTEDAAVRNLVRAIEHTATRAAVEAERTALATLEGGCRVPIGALAAVDGGVLHLEVAVVTPDGGTMLRETGSGTVDAARALGVRVGEILRRRLEEQHQVLRPGH